MEAVVQLCVVITEVEDFYSKISVAYARLVQGFQLASPVILSWCMVHCTVLYSAMRCAVSPARCSKPYPAGTSTLVL